MSSRAFVVVTLGLGLAITITIGCSSFSATAPDPSPPGDATIDGDATTDSTDSASAADGDDTDGGIEGGADAGCTGHFCGGVCVDGPSCGGCAEGELLCAATRTCVSACAACQPTSFECWTCPPPTAQAIGSCEPVPGAFCLGAAYTHCSCAGDGGVALCPGATHTCINNLCTTCGESMSTDGRTCKDNASCMRISHQCQ